MGEIETEVEIEGDSGFAAVGILKTLHPKSANDTNVGSLSQRQRFCIEPLSRAQVCA